MRQLLTSIAFLFLTVSGAMTGWAETGRYLYAVTGGTGTVTAGGLTQPTHVDATGEVRITRTGSTSAMLILPQQVAPEGVNLTGRGTGPWTGGFGSWGGMPMPVSVTLTGLGEQTATLLLEGNNQLASMTISLDLAARSLPAQ